MPQTVRFGCKNCGSPHLREKENKLFCASCGSVFEKNIETSEERDARILYLSRLDNSESYLRMSPPNFDEAEDRYRDFIKHYPENSDGYWGLVRARYGIKYETDASGKEIPSCYKSSYEDFRKDSDFLKALELAENEHISDDYFEKAKLIAGVCKEWREEAKKYEYDVFISFKATDDKTGKPTADTAEMQELYTYLLEEGYKVFFSPMSMRRYSGKHYDAYIFNALQSAKVMIVYGSKPEYFTTTWVQNEWTRFLRMQAKGEKKNGACVVAYKDFNPKELPHNLRAIQAMNFADKKFYLEITNCIKNLLTEEKEVDTNAELLKKIADLERQQEESRKRLREMEDNRAEAASATKAEEARKAYEARKAEETKRKAEEEAKRKIEELKKKSVGDFEIENGVLKKYKGNATKVVIQGSVTSIGDWAFWDCKSLTEIVIPNSVTSIGNSAFSCCSSLTEVVIPSSVTSIDHGAFFYCSSLTEIVIPSSVISIGSGAFTNCEKVKIYLENPKNIKKWDENWNKDGLGKSYGTVYDKRTGKEIKRNIFGKYVV